MDKLKKYPEVQFVDFPAQLDEYIANIDSIPKAQLNNDYAFFKLYYFDHNDDPARNQPFIDRLKELDTGS